MNGGATLFTFQKIILNMGSRMTLRQAQGDTTLITHQIIQWPTVSLSLSKT